MNKTMMHGLATMTHWRVATGEICAGPQSPGCDTNLALLLEYEFKQLAGACCMQGAETESWACLYSSQSWSGQLLCIGPPSGACPLLITNQRASATASHSVILWALFCTSCGCFSVVLAVHDLHAPRRRPTSV
jgi:hypothetical protein